MILRIGYSADMFGRRLNQLRLFAWALTIVATLLVALTITSIWGNMWIAWSDKCIAVFHGQIAFRWGFSNPGLQILSPGSHVRWFDADWEWFRRSYQKSAFGAVNAPLWLIAIIVSVAAAWCWHAARTISLMGRCRKCGYDLRGLGEQTVCPECGRPFARGR